MIIKSLRHAVRSSRYSVNYIFDGMPNDKKQQWVVFQNISQGFTRESIINELNVQANYIASNANRKKTIRYHEILAFSHLNKKDLDRERLQRIAKKYLSLRDPNGSAMAICVPHLEKHAHIHLLLTSNNLESNKSGDMHMSNAEYYSLRRNMERWTLQQFPELHHSSVYLPEEEITKILPKKYLAQRRMQKLSASKQNKGAVKDHIISLVIAALEKSTSIKDFTSRINEMEGIQTYTRRGKLTGIVYQGNRKFRFSSLRINLMEENFNVLRRLGELKERDTKDNDKVLER